MEAYIETDNGLAKSIHSACWEEWQAGYLRWCDIIDVLTDVLSLVSDWLESALHRFDWLRAPYLKHQFENQFEFCSE